MKWCDTSSEHRTTTTVLSEWYILLMDVKWFSPVPCLNTFQCKFKNAELSCGRVIMHVHMLKLAAYPFNIFFFFFGPDSLLCLGSFGSHPFRHNGIHSRKIIKTQFRDCFYNQQPGAPLFFFYYFSNQSRSISFPLSIKDCFPSAVLLMQGSLRPPRVSLLRKTFSSLDSSMHN